jgi:lysyl-tRNA synthetase class 1
MIWVDREVKKIKELGCASHWVDDMKTPSGRIHVGALRGVVIHDLVYKVLRENEIDAKFTYIFDNFDVMDGLPTYLDKSVYEKYMGMPLCNIPSPEKGYKSFADYYAADFQNVFERINCHPEILYSHDLYKSGQMDNVIKQALDKADIVRKIYLEVSKVEKPDDWFAFAPICDSCGKIGTTTVYKWDGENVYYRCEENKVKWAKGCGHDGKKSPYKAGGKLTWKLEWPGKWKSLGITIEGGGKDHMSSGGSHDMAIHISKEVFNYPVPFSLPYEWFVVGGKKMSSSKGVGCAACDISATLPAEVLRFLIVRNSINTVIDFNPEGDTILNLFDDYDKCLNAYFDKQENKIPDGKKGEVLLDFARISELSQVREIYAQRIYLPRFRTVVSLIKSKADIENYFVKLLGRALVPDEKDILEERVVYGKIYLNEYAVEENTCKFSSCISPDIILSNEEKIFLQELKNNLKEGMEREEIQNVFFNTLKEKNILPKIAFSSFYKITIGQEKGPKVADLILDIGIKKTIDRLSEIK